VVELIEVGVRELPLNVFGPLIGSERLTVLESAAAASSSLLEGSVVWNVNSTGSGGGVAEMLRVLVGYSRGAGIDTRWVILEGDPRFFRVTKRIHNRIHGMPGDPGGLDAAEAAHYDDVCAANASALSRRLGAHDVVLLHDPQTVGMAPWLRESGVKMIWRSHVGTDISNQWTEQAWAFLRPYLGSCDAFVFSREAYVPGWLPAERVSIIAPSIDPFSPKNQAVGDGDLRRILGQVGLIPAPVRGAAATFTRADGTTGHVVHQANITSEGQLGAGARLVVQVSRWDRLKDMGGVLIGFADHVAGRVDADLALVGPMVDGVADDPEGTEVLAECVALWESLPLGRRRRIRLVSLPMLDIDENAVMVNALQRSASVIVQKSLAEGFGLTVAEGMWKGKPVVASRVGGIIDQVAPGTGILLDDPTDLAAYGDAVTRLLEHPEDIERLGTNARRRVLDDFVGDRHLLQYAALIEQLLVR
jgi:trehalose synthase